MMLPKAMALAVALATLVASAAPIKRPWQEDVMYMIMTDRFNDGDKANDQDVTGSSTGYHGGDFQGIIDKLDYLKDLGVTAVWITPPMQNQKGGYHGYWITDFMQVDPHLGDMATLKKLVDEAHKRQIKVLLDVVVNHTGGASPWVGDPTKASWFHQQGGINNWNNQSEIENGKLSGLPDLAQENPEVRKYLIDMSLWWIDQTGVDGFRLDTVRHVPKDFWVDYVKAIHAKYPDFFLVGEVWNNDLPYLEGYLNTGLTSLMDFARQSALSDTFGKGADPSMLHATVAREIKETPTVPWGVFADNHDMPRFVTGNTPSGEQKLRLALADMLTSPGMPIIYYGTEVALQGGDDPDNRRDMKFDSNPAMTEYTRRLIDLRKQTPAFAYGTYTPVTKNAKVVSYIREYQGAKYLVALNNSKDPQTLDLSGVVEPQKRLVNLLGSERLDNVSTLNLDAWTPYVFQVTDRPAFLSVPVLAGGGAGVVVVIGGVVFLLRRRREKVA